MSEVDLSALRIDTGRAAVPRRPIGPRLLVLAVLLLVLVIGATFLWPLLWPARGVRMAAVLPATTTSSAPTSATAEAVGWVEADPFPVLVHPLVSGRIESLEVLEGARVERGKTVIAQLASAQLLAARDRAVVAVAEREAGATAAHADHRLASDRLTQNTEARLRVRDAEGKVAAIATRLAAARERHRESQASARSATVNETAQERLEAAGNSYPVALERARADAAAARSAAAAAAAEVAGLEQEIATAQATLQLCEELVTEPVDLRGAVAIAAANVDRAVAAHTAATTELAIAERELGWATVTAPVDGVVLKLLAEPGDTVGPAAKGIVALYDPNKLRARIDVPLDSIDNVHEGQQVEVRSQATGNTVVRGVVQRLQHESDLLKNTLQVKIGLSEPPPLLRPETLCRARFLADASTGAAPTVHAFRVPKAAVQNGHVFVFEPAAGTARAIPVEVVGADDDLLVVRGELSVTQRVVLDAVTAGEAIQETRR